jgi:hypothetical protein
MLSSALLKSESDYRVRFTEELDGTLHIHAVRHRGEAYR